MAVLRPGLGTTDAHDSLQLRLHSLGIPNLPNRSRAIREMLRQAPAIIVAGMLGYSSTGAEKIATEYGLAWQHNASFDRQPRRLPRLTERGTRHASSRQCAS